MKEKIVVISFISILFIFMILGFLIPDEEISFSERRHLKSFPKFEVKEIVSENGTYFEDMNDYFVDHFPFRDTFRKIKGTTLASVFRKNENHGVSISGDTIYQMDATLNEKSVEHLVKKIQYVDTTYLTNQNVYFGLIPDKNYYLEDRMVPKLDYKRLENTLKTSLPSRYHFVDLTNTLNLDSYYRTDIHWRQEKLEPVVNQLRGEMGLESYPFPSNLKTYNPFYGALYGRIATNIKPDTLSYLTDSVIENATVFNYEKKVNQKVYTDSYLKNVDSYDVFLSGATPLLVIENKMQANGKELILFRDSFGSSIAPLLISNYSKITMIDLRYLSSTLLGSILEIHFDNPNTDVLFLYSVPIINNSFTLK